MNQLETLFYNGQFHACFELAQQNTDELSNYFCQLFERYHYSDIPKYTEKTSKQSIERADESYPEMDELQKIRQVKDETKFTIAIQQLEREARDGDDEQKALSFFVQGHLFLMAHHYDESVHCFMQATKYNPSKALFYGFAAQTMHRFNWTPFEVMGYLERAIELDSDNARWLWNKGLVLTQLYKDLQQQTFLENALITLENALMACREEQKSLKNAIENTLENMRDYVFS